MKARIGGSLLSVAVLALALFSVGCEQAAPEQNQDTAQAKTKHDDWWCQEHGIPEEICSLCSAKAAAKFKKEGDWCKIHDRALSQCFKCDPKKYAKFEALYVAKYGKKPTPPPAEEFQK